MRPRSAIIVACLAAALMKFIPGCGDKAPPPLPPPSNKAEERAYWEHQYSMRRPEAPATYTVFPKPPRDNSFAEFDDSRYHGLDPQPELPPLPSQTGPQPMPLGSVPPMAGDRELAARVADSRPPRIGTGMGGAGSGTHYYPVEQLIYGGDYPDLDKPEEYRLMPHDQVSMTVRDHPEFDGMMEVQLDGTVRIPNTPDTVRVRGLTVEEATNAIAKTIGPYIKGETKVRLQTNRARGGYYYVFGEVRQPGRFPLGMEPVKLSEAILAANWEANPRREDMNGDELTPSFPAAVPRGRFTAPETSDMSRVQLVTPHRSRPARTTHDARAALLGMTGDDPIIRPGQIIMVPSISAERNRQWGLEEKGFADAGSKPTLPSNYIQPPRAAKAAPPPPPQKSSAEKTMEIINETPDIISTRSPEEMEYIPADAVPAKQPRQPTKMKGWN